VYNDTHTFDQFLNLHVEFSLNFVFVFTYLVLLHFCISLHNFIPVLLAFVVLGLVSSVPRQGIGWKERLQKDLFFVEWDKKTSKSINQSWLGNVIKH